MQSINEGRRTMLVVGPGEGGFLHRSMIGRTRQLHIYGPTGYSIVAGLAPERLRSDRVREYSTRPRLYQTLLHEPLAGMIKKKLQVRVDVLLDLRLFANWNRRHGIARGARSFALTPSFEARRYMHMYLMMEWYKARPFADWRRMWPIT